MPRSGTVRPFQETDRAAVVALWQACGLTRPWNDPQRDIDRKLADSPALLGVLVDEQGRVQGSVMAGYDGHRGWINYLAVAPGAQRLGQGRRLMDWAEARLRERGCPKINLQVRAENAAVLAFYAALGYTQDPVLSLGKRLEHDGPPPAA